MPKADTLDRCAESFVAKLMNKNHRSLRRKLIRIADISHRNSKNLNKRHNTGYTTKKSIKTDFYKLKSTQLINKGN